MEAVLVIALILSNIGWLVYADRNDKRNQEERTELHNRIAEPSLIVPPKDVVQARVKAAVKPNDPEFPSDEFELAAVGTVDPTLDRKPE